MNTAMLWDLRAIEQVYFRYCEVIDAKDFDRLDAVFTPDAIGDYRSTNGILQRGLAPLVARLHIGMGAGSHCGATQHNVFNIRATIQGDIATSQAISTPFTPGWGHSPDRSIPAGADMTTPGPEHRQDGASRKDSIAIS